ncbi:hypothetical protein PVAND_001493 [Polypedilum vanderplanki]|uniref:BTB domain-containing protein n=1 Tax=Polypedilum vanderplanki TaxID=319348 RepID=A0A9J6BNK6_POLVA|nr:hypothetical protein PVAND_001493 [Polypedilum vanderplanki]
MSKEFEFKLPSITFLDEESETKVFNNEYGNWTISLNYKVNYLFGTIVYESIFDKHLIDTKQIQVNVQISEPNYRNLFSSIAAKNCGGTTFLFEYMSNSHYSYLRTNFQISVKVKLPEVKYKLINHEGAKGHLKKLFETGNHADITIQSNGKELKVHKLILMRSEVFEKMLTGPTKEAQSGIIVIKDFKFEVIAEMCRYLYYDEIPKIQTLALLLLIAADKYMVEDLADKCEKFLLKNVNSVNFHDILITADRLNKNALREAAIDYIIANRKEIFPSAKWKELKNNNVQLALLVTEKFMMTNA